ncbi:hypothetical protein FB451DRAFT_1399071 [Mycena latifolia]|nr:hypothetical protein FB451DRAFT_1399071 [Mycena latifolia]
MDKDSPTSARKRPRENETASQRLKREKAAERQRRKRERDRQANGLAPPQMPYPAQPQDPHYPHPHQPQNYLAPPPPPQEDTLSPDEQARRERVRAAARERQRKHRQLVKQRKMRELGLDMGNEILPGLDEVHYRVAPDGQYQQVMAHEMQQAQAQAVHQHHLQQQQQQQQAQQAAAAAQGQPAPQGEPPFPQGPAHGGQTFATTLLLSFSCAPLLKQHLLRTLNMTNDELASLEPVIAEAWDRWDHGRRLQYDHAQAQEQGFPPGGVPVPGGAAPYPPPYAPGPGPASAGGDFRERFQRVMAVPAPFRASFAAANGAGPEGGPGATTPSSASGSGSAAGAGPGGVDAIDPHLGGPKEEGGEA